MSTENGTLTQDDVFDILSSARRRYVLYLLRTEGEMELTTLAEHVAAWENDTEVDELTKQQRKRVYVSLYQTHVPKLSDAGLVDYDEDSGQVSLKRQARDIDQYLRPESESTQWQYIYAPYVVIGAAIALLSVADVWVFGTLSMAELGLVLVAGLVLSTAVHAGLWYANQQEVPEDLQRQR